MSKNIYLDIVAILCYCIYVSCTADILPYYIGAEGIKKP